MKDQTCSDTVEPSTTAPPPTETDATETAAETTPTDGPSTSDVPPALSSGAGGPQFSITISRRGILRGLAGLVVVALMILTGLLGWHDRQQAHTLDAFDESKAASEQFVTKLVSTLNKDNANNYKELLGPLSTGKLRERLEQDRQATQQNVESLKLEATTTIKVSSVESFSTDSAKTLVMAEVTGRSATAPDGTSNLMVFRLDLDKEKGKWLVSNIDGSPGSPNGQIDPSKSMPGVNGGAPSASAAPTTPAPQP